MEFITFTLSQAEEKKKNPETLLVTELINPGLEIDTRTVSGSLPGSSLSLLITLGDSPGACVAHSNQSAPGMFVKPATLSSCFCVLLFQ